MRPYAKLIDPYQWTAIWPSRKGDEILYTDTDTGSDPLQRMHFIACLFHVEG